MSTSLKSNGSPTPRSCKNLEGETANGIGAPVPEKVIRTKQAWELGICTGIVTGFGCCYLGRAFSAAAFGQPTIDPLPDFVLASMALLCAGILVGLFRRTNRGEQA